MDATINGARIHYERSGKGFPLVLIHAGIADSRMWEPQATAFAHDFDVITPDLRGFGGSELPPGPYSMMADIVGLLDHLGIKQAHVVGCSMGGSVALDLAIAHPERTARLVLVGSGVSGANFGQADKALFVDVDAADEKGDLDAVNRAEVRLWVDGPRRVEGAAPKRTRDLVLDMNGRALRSNWDGAKHEALDPPAAGRLESLRAPVLVIVGDEDLPHVGVAADVLASEIPGARKVVIKDAAHLPSLERPDEFNRIVRDFLAS
jgi:3-oxoadipate enol-lactonase